MKTRILDKWAALSFIDNMRYFADMGKVSWKQVSPDCWQVRASEAAWSYWTDLCKQADGLLKEGL